MELHQIRPIAEEVVSALQPGCDRIEIAGSIRRLKPNPKDVEIVYIPGVIEHRVDLFNSATGPATEPILDDLLLRDIIAWDQQVKRAGPKYKRFVHCASGVVLELFVAQPSNWGLILALRTGPGEFNHILVSKPWQGGAMPVDMRMQGAFLWRRGKQLITPTEESFFSEIGIPCWPPSERTPERLRDHLSRR